MVGKKFLSRGKFVAVLNYFQVQSVNFETDKGGDLQQAEVRTSIRNKISLPFLSLKEKRKTLIHIIMKFLLSKCCFIRLPLF